MNILSENELNDSVIEDIEEEVDVFKKIENKKESNKKKDVKKNKKKSIKIKYFHRLNEELYKYHDLHMSKSTRKRRIRRGHR